VDNTDFSREKSESERKQLKIKDIERAEDVWTEKGGTRTEVALLYLSMLRAVGLTAYAIRVVNRELRYLHARRTSTSTSSTILVILVNIDGKEILLDPGEKMCPFPTVQLEALRMLPVSARTSSGSAIATTPHQSYTANTIERIAEFALDEPGRHRRRHSLHHERARKHFTGAKNPLKNDEVRSQNAI
jgi:hypothetical protein